MRKKKAYNIAVVGVGVVGQEMLRILRERNFPIKNLKVFARSSRQIQVDDTRYDVQEIAADGFEGMDIALFAGTEGEKGASVTFAAEAVKRGAVVIDNGADFRMDSDVPLVVPEVNPKDAKKHSKKGIISNPNCSTIQMVVALGPIHKVTKLKRVIVSSYQAVSGAGRGGVSQLEDEIKDREVLTKAFAYRIAMNVIPQIGSFGDNDFTSEEWKMVRETRKILHKPKLAINATTVRVPVINGHSESIYVELDRPLDPEEAKRLLSQQPGIQVTDAADDYPMPVDADGKDPVFVGRIRQDPDNAHGLAFWVVSDNLRKGAALNAIQIAETLLKNR